MRRPAVSVCWAMTPRERWRQLARRRACSNAAIACGTLVLILRPGSNAELQLVDERIVGPAPRTVSASDAAALPLTALTAWEMLFERLRVNRAVAAGNRSIVIVGGAGGVGSIAIQIAKRVAGMTVVATASRPEYDGLVPSLGADHVVDHSKSLAAEVKALGIGAPGFVFATTETERHFDEIVELIAPQGRFGVISGVGRSEIGKLSGKSITLCFELMFTRPIFAPPDMEEQHRILAEVSRLVDDGVLRTTRHDDFGRITAANLARAHAHVEFGPSNREGRARRLLSMSTFGRGNRHAYMAPDFYRSKSPNEATKATY